MSIISGICSIFVGVFSTLVMSFTPVRSEIVVDDRELINNARIIYNNSPRNLEECNFYDFLERLGLRVGLTEIVIYKNDDTYEIIPI